MIERLENCPNCGAILDEVGRCSYCGSKVYDFCDIDVSSVNRHSTYIRIKVDNKTIVAPIRTNYVNMEFSRDAFPTMNVEFIITGDTIIKEG